MSTCLVLLKLCKYFSAQICQESTAAGGGIFTVGNGGEEIFKDKDGSFYVHYTGFAGK